MGVAIDLPEVTSHRGLLHLSRIHNRWDRAPFVFYLLCHRETLSPE
jgi:hypothetical protein